MTPVAPIGHRRLGRLALALALGAAAWPAARVLSLGSRPSLEALQALVCRAVPGPLAPTGTDLALPQANGAPVAPKEAAP